MPEKVKPESADWSGSWEDTLLKINNPKNTFCIPKFGYP